MAAVMIHRRSEVSSSCKNFDTIRSRKMSVTSWKSVKSMTSWKSCLSKQYEGSEDDEDSDYGSKSDGTKTRSNSGSGHSIKTRRDSVLSKKRKISRRESALYAHITVSDVRVYLLNEMNKNREKYYASDFKRVESNDWFIQRHILDHEESNVTPTNLTMFNASILNVSKQILSMLQWKKECNIHDTAKFAASFFTAGILTYGRDPSTGQLYMFIRGTLKYFFYRALMKNDEKLIFFKKFF